MKHETWFRKLSYSIISVRAASKNALTGSAVGRWVLVPYRFWHASKYFFVPWLKVGPWLFWSKETVNYTYELSDLSRETLAALVAEIAGVPTGEVRGFLQELDQDSGMRELVKRRTEEGSRVGVSDTVVRPGKRYAYYALIRALKPKLTIEAGVDKGLGTVIMASALLRNGAEGQPGRLLGLDIAPDAGFLLDEPYATVAEVKLGDAVTAIVELADQVDLFIQEISPGIEETLLNALEPHLNEFGVAVSAWHTGAMLRFAERTNRRFVVHVEETKDHWYPGSRVSVAYRRR